MNDMNSRYRNIDSQADVIRTNTDSYGFDDMDIMEAENAQKKKQVVRASQARGGSGSRGRKAKRQILIYSIIIAVEVVILAGIWIGFAVSNSSGSSSKKSKKESSESSDNGSSGSINVENDDFTLTCTKLAITTDTSGNPCAVVYFTFINKTDSALSMSQVYNPSFTQSGMQLSETTSLAEDVIEISNYTAQVSNGQSIDCAKAVVLQDTTSDITITMRDMYETFSDIGSTVVQISAN